MSDFLVNMGGQYSPESLLVLLKRPYGKKAPEGKCYKFSWGSLAILEERLAGNRNIIDMDGAVFAWVGDLVTEMSDSYLYAIIQRLEELHKTDAKAVISLESDPLFEKLNGAFAILYASENILTIVTDPMNFTPVYLGQDDNDTIVSLGTHPDLVASLFAFMPKVDRVSLGEFLVSGCCTFPNTAYSDVKELNPGFAYFFSSTERTPSSGKAFKYWTPPDESQNRIETDEMVLDLKSLLRQAVVERCSNKKTGIFLSGGIDSRTVLALVPKEKCCIGVTFSNNFNREVRTAKKIARCYMRNWTWLQRDSEYLAKSINDIVSLVGCESDWVEAHNNGFSDELLRLGCEYYMTGYLFDMYYKACYSMEHYKNQPQGSPNNKNEKDITCYVAEVGDFWCLCLNATLLPMIQRRRNTFYKNAFDTTKRDDVVEWIRLYPFSQEPHAYWFASRRVIPMRMVAADRKLLEFTFKCPVYLKKNKVFNRIAQEICSDSFWIPNANDGVRLGSGHLSRLAQRAIRKISDKSIRLLERLGKKPVIQHSWHDYQKYWQESKKLDELRLEYGTNLDQFDGILFNKSGRMLLNDKTIDWRYGFRLLQLAVWVKIKEEYRNVLRGEI